MYIVQCNSISGTELKNQLQTGYNVMGKIIPRNRRSVQIQ